MIANWIYEKNLKPLLETISQLVGYSFSDCDWATVRIGMTGTNDENEKWYEFELNGEKHISVQLAADPGLSVVHIRLQSHLEVEEKAETAIGIFQNE